MIKTARSAWNYERDDDKENWVGGQPQIVLPANDVDAFCQIKNGADAMLLFAMTKRNHGGRIEPFALDGNAMMRDNLIFGWGRDRYRNAVKSLISMGYLVCVKKGGYGPHTPNEYRLSEVSPKAS